jgi:hypothetical protein
VNPLKSSSGFPSASLTKNTIAFKACRCVATADRCRVAKSDRKSLNSISPAENTLPLRPSSHAAKRLAHIR